MYRYHILHPFKFTKIFSTLWIIAFVCCNDVSGNKAKACFHLCGEFMPYSNWGLHGRGGFGVGGKFGLGTTIGGEYGRDKKVTHRESDDIYDSERRAYRVFGEVSPEIGVSVSVGGYKGGGGGGGGGSRGPHRFPSGIGVSGVDGVKGSDGVSGVKGLHGRGGLLWVPKGQQYYY